VKLISQKCVVDAQHSARAPSSCEKALPRVRHVFLCGQETNAILRADCHVSEKTLINRAEHSAGI
jgi:hypothetical protein